MNPVGLVLRLTARTFWTWRSLLGFAASLSLVGMGAWIGRGRSGAADRSLLVIAFGLVIPIFAYAMFQWVTNGQRLDRAIEKIARHGLSRRWALLGAVFALSLALTLTSTLLSAFAVAVSRDASDPALARDLFASGSIGAFAGGAYTAWFALGSSFGARGGGRKWVLVLDFVLGSSAGPLGVIFPRAQLRNLLGAEPPLGLSQGAGAAVLLTSSLVALLIAIRRTPN